MSESKPKQRRKSKSPVGHEFEDLDLGRIEDPIDGLELEGQGGGDGLAKGDLVPDGDFRGGDGLAQEDLVSDGDLGYFRLTSPPSEAPVDPADQEMVRVNLIVSRGLHKRIRKYAIDYDDKSLVATIQDILEDYLSSKGY